MKPTEIEAARAHGIDPKEFKVGLDGIAVVVNPKNPVDKLTIAQLRDIFTGRVTNWKDVGGQDGKIVILSREVNSGTHVFFKEHVLTQNGKQEEFAAQALLLSSSQAIADEVTHNVNAIGYYGMGYISDKQKALAVAKDEKSVYEKPSVDNVRSGVYPIARPLLMYTAGEPQGSVKAFIDFVLSSQGQKIVEQIDFVPISK
jgi:phosphate transport system substrate-binding protein